jgi:hypothetical protein
MPESMKKVAIPTAIAASALLLMAPMLALAQNPHFIGTPTISKNSDGSLTAKFKAAGLGNSATDVFLTSSGGSADLQCVNRGQNEPAPKAFTFDDLASERVTVNPRNGQVTATTDPLGPPDLPSADEVCPNRNWTVKIESITYENVELHIQQDGVDLLNFDFGNVDP